MWTEYWRRYERTKDAIGLRCEYIQELAPVMNIDGKIKLFHPEEMYDNQN